MTNGPVVSVLIPILNEESNLADCLGSLVAQDYPKTSFEILIADGGSTDRSLEIVREFDSKLPITVVDNSKRKEAEWGKALAFEAASGKYVQCMDADMKPSSPTFFSRLVEIMESDDNLAGVVARYFPSPELSRWSRFLSYDEFQRDPLFQVLTPSMDEFIAERHSQFDVCIFPTPRVPPMGGTTMLRREDIDLRRWGGRWSEIDGIAYLVKRGHKRFGYVRDVGWIHEHCLSLKHLLQKRRRNILGISHGFLRSNMERDFIWLDTTDAGEVIRVGIFVLQANLLLPELVRGFRDSIRHRSWEQILRPIASIAIADVLTWDFIRSEEGRQFLRRLVRLHSTFDIALGANASISGTVNDSEQEQTTSEPLELE